MHQVGQALHQGKSVGRSSAVTSSAAPSLEGLCFDIILITEILPPQFFIIYLCFILRVIMKTKCLWRGTENFLLISQLLAIGLYWECKGAYPPGPSLREGSIYNLVSYVGQRWPHWKFTWSSAKHLPPPFKYPH